MWNFQRKVYSRVALHQPLPQGGVKILSAVDGTPHSLDEKFAKQWNSNIHFCPNIRSEKPASYAVGCLALNVSFVGCCPSGALLLVRALLLFSLHTMFLAGKMLSVTSETESSSGMLPSQFPLFAPCFVAVSFGLLIPRLMHWFDTFWFKAGKKKKIYHGFFIVLLFTLLKASFTC